MKLYNTLTKKIEEIKTLEPNKVKMYICGPTVYNTPTIANLRTYISQDVLRRSLKYLGYNVEEVMNITDIEDKIIRDSKNAGYNPEDKAQLKKFTSKFEDVFFDNLKALNIEPVEYTPHATDPEVVDKMIEIISNLLDKGIAYKSEDGSLYFSIDKYKEYGKLSNLDKREVKTGARVAQDEYDKENAQDFALWKATKGGEPSWEAPFGKGRPGWHIECSAMSIMNLGETIDIHGGGVDLIFPHHENEIAQSEAYTGKTFVNTWFHAGHLMVDGQRMGKSLNNFYTLDDLVEKFKVDPLSLRMLSLQSHYRDSLNFTDKSIQAAENTLRGLNEFVSRTLETKATRDDFRIDTLTKDVRIKFREAISDDLNTPKATAIIFDYIKEVNKLFVQGLSELEREYVLDFITEIDDVLGLRLSAKKLKIGNEKIYALVKKREDARARKDWSEADKMREEIRELGYDVEDTISGPRLVKL